MRDTIDMAREAGWKGLRDYGSEMQHDFFMGNTDSLKAFEALVRADAIADERSVEREKFKHNEEVLINALWKACGDDEEVVNATIESQGKLK
jgi:hypothetical protein